MIMVVGIERRMREGMSSEKKLKSGAHVCCGAETLCVVLRRNGG
jgi:hypothetical protein